MKRRRYKFAYAIRKYASPSASSIRVNRMLEDEASKIVGPSDIPKTLEEYDTLYDKLRGVADRVKMKTMLKGYGIPAISGVGGGVIGSGGGYLLSKIIGGRNPKAWATAGGLLGAGTGLAISLPLTSEGREDYSTAKSLSNEFESDFRMGRELYKGRMRDDKKSE